MPGLTRQEKKRRAERQPVVETGPTSHQHETKRRRFDDFYEALAVYKAESTHTNVPCNYEKDPALGKWVSRTRGSQGTKLTPQQKTKLDQLGFDWESKNTKDEKRWNGMLEKLKKYRKAHKNCCVPKPWPSDPQLGYWVNTQRKKQVLNILPLHRKEQLDAIKFQWSSQPERTVKVDSSVADGKWLNKYQMLVTYCEEHGDCLVPKKKGKGGQHAALANWVKRQREDYRNGKLKEERKKWLDDLGFVYKNKTQKQWDDMFQQLVDFKEKTGHVEVPYTKRGLGNWVSMQKGEARKGRLDQRRAVRLQEIGITWGKSFDERWENGFAMLAKYQKKYGHCGVPQHHNGNESNRKLYNWAQHQRASQAKGVLLPGRKERLEAIGFPFGDWKSSRDYYSDEADDTKDAVPRSMEEKTSAPTVTRSLTDNDNEMQALAASTSKHGNTDSVDMPATGRFECEV